MSSNIRKIINEIYNQSQDFRKRKFDIHKYKPFIEQCNPVELIVIAFKEFPGNFARKLLLYTLKWWKDFNLEIFIKALNELHNDELGVVYWVSFVKRYFDYDLTPYSSNKDLYLQPITYFEHSREWVLELERMKIDLQYLKSLKEKLKSVEIINSS